jgi:hypothetical protein
VYSALHGQPATADDIEADYGDMRVRWKSGQPGSGRHGQCRSAVVAFQDITQRKQAEAERLNIANTSSRLWIKEPQSYLLSMSNCRCA